MILTALLVVMLLFRVRTVKVYGNTRHSSKEIASGLVHDALTHNTLYFLWKYKDGDIPDSMPYLETLHVQVKSLSRVEVEVTEKELAGYLSDPAGNVCFDREGTILEITNDDRSDLPLITGVNTGEPVLYQKLPTESSAQLRTILSLTELLSYHELQATEIRFGENMEITVFVGGIEAQLGQDEYLEEKVANLNKILPRLDGQRGILHLETFTGRNETVSFTPAGSDELSALDEGSDGAGAGDTGGGGSGDAGSGDSGGADTGGGTGSGDAGSADGTGSGDAGTVGADAGNGDGTGSDGADTGSGDAGAGAQDGGSAADLSGVNGDGSGDADGGSQSIYVVFNSSGGLVYNVHVENGTVVDENGNPVPGCSVNEDGYVVDGYMNVIDPATGELVQ